VVTATGLGLC